MVAVRRQDTYAGAVHSGSNRSHKSETRIKRILGISTEDSDGEKKLFITFYNVI